uniref:Uncharacterized protein n=1 Tax=Anguilla anguilla TaxID=7936 RepID=A0A0E9T4P4_ANGAN
MYIKWNPFLITFQTVTWGIKLQVPKHVMCTTILI